MEKKEAQTKEPMTDKLLEERLKELDAKINLYESKLKELELKSAVVPNVKTAKQEQNKSEQRKLRDEIARAYETVKGRFKFYEVPGGSLSFVFKKLTSAGKPTKC